MGSERSMPEDNDCEPEFGSGDVVPQNSLGDCSPPLHMHSFHRQVRTHNAPHRRHAHGNGNASSGDEVLERAIMAAGTSPEMKGMVTQVEFASNLLESF